LNAEPCRAGCLAILFLRFLPAVNIRFARHRLKASSASFTVPDKVPSAATVIAWHCQLCFVRTGRGFYNQGKPHDQI